MKKYVIILLVIIGLLLAVIAPANVATTVTNIENEPDTLTLTLKEAVFFALRNNHKIKSAEVARISQKYAVVAAKHSFRPRYSLQGSYQYLSSTAHKDRHFSNAFDVQPKISLLTPYGTELGLSMNNHTTKEGNGHTEWKYTPSLTFEITQPLIRGFGRDVVEATLKNAIDNEEINTLQYRDVVADTINAVISDYINLARAIETLKISRVSLASYQTIVKKAKALIEAGRMAKNDIIQVEAQIAFQTSVIENNKNELMRAQGKLLNTLGLDNQMSVKIPENINYEEIESIFIEKEGLPMVDTCKKLVLTNNASYQIARTMLKILGRSLLVAKDGTNWKLDLVASANRYGREDRENSNINNLMRNREHNEKIAINLNIPIDDVSAKKAVIDAQVSLDQSKLSYQQLKRQLELDVMTMHNAVINAKRQLDLLKQALKLQYKTVEAAELKYSAGRISNFELLNNQKDLSTLNQSVINSQVIYINTLATFNKILGETLSRFAIKLVY